MCGIVGIFDFRGQPVAMSEIVGMVRSLRHRGPDHEGIYIKQGIGLGNSRLSIIDLSPAGHQPMANEDGSLLIVFNGELYNFPELVPLLEARGHRFHSHSDTEVIVHAFEEWGTDCIHRFNGMFGFAIWDQKEQRLFLARDRFGIKPLYYAIHDGRFLFASEIKALLEAGIPRSVWKEALIEYFTFQNLFSDLTLFEGIRLLPPGHTLSVSQAGIQTSQYWDLALEPEESIPEEEWVIRLRDVFAESVTRQLISDVPVGSYLSGGMDSASIVAVARQHIPRLMTFTGGFDLSSVSGLELVFDERDDAEIVSNAFRTEHYQMVMHAGDMAWVLPKLVWHLEDLRVGMCYQNYYIARLASKFVKVSLAGTGGDEMFAGYPWRYGLVADAKNREIFDRRYYGYWTRLRSDPEKADFFTSEIWSAARNHAPFDIYRQVIRPVDDLDPISKALYFEAKTFLHGLLIVEDRVSMAHSLEVRVPFLDNQLVDLVRRMPPHLKFNDGTGKQVLRHAMRDLLPAQILEKKKHGFSPPDGSWYRGESMDYIRRILLSERSLNRGYFQPAHIRRILTEHLEGRVNHRLLIWSLLSFEWWNRIFMDGESHVASEAINLPSISPEPGLPL